MVIFLSPYIENKVWAGDHINKLYKKDGKNGEAWIVSGYLKKSSKIINGKYKDLTLEELWKNHTELFGNLDYINFPILIKLISTSESLSLQVHPDNNYAKKNHNANGKFETWYIIENDLNNKIITGVNCKDKEELLKLLDSKIIEKKFKYTFVKKDDLVVIDYGQIHAIPANYFILEIQEPSDITYRLYDYNRIGRDLHINDALNVIDLSKNPQIIDMNKNDFRSSKFNISMKKINKSYKTNNLYFTIIYVIDGYGTLNGESINKNDSLIVLNSTNDILIEGNLKIILVTPNNENMEDL